VHARNTGALPNIPDQRLQEIRHATETNEEARQLLQTIQNGWPPQRDQLSPRVRPYFSFPDTLSHDSGLIVKGERIFISFPARAQIKAQLHSAHLGYDSMLCRARDTMFWIGMNNDIKQLADNCDVCQQNKPCNSRSLCNNMLKVDRPGKKVVSICLNSTKNIIWSLLTIFPIFFKLTFSTLRPQVL